MEVIAETNPNSMQVTVDVIYKLWPVVAAILGIIWKQIADHFEQRQLKATQIILQKKNAHLEGKVNAIEKDFADNLKDHVIENKENYKEMRDAITELIKSTSIIATKMEVFSNNFTSHHNNNNKGG